MTLEFIQSRENMRVNHITNRKAQTVDSCFSIRIITEEQSGQFIKASVDRLLIHTEKDSHAHIIPTVGGISTRPLNVSTKMTKKLRRLQRQRRLQQLQQLR